MATYGDPSQERLGNGRSMAELMRGGLKGIQGVIVSPSTPGGTPINFNPHAKSTMEINIEPEGPNRQVMTLDRMTAENIDQAMTSASEKFPGGDINSIRERTAMAFEELARMTKSSVQRVPVKAARSTPIPRVTVSQAPPEYDEEALIAELQEEIDQPAIPSRPPVDKIDRNYSPMAAFGLKKQAMPAAQTTGQITPSAKVAAPQKLIYFEKEGIGTVPAFFHDVIVSVARQDPDSPEQSGFIVLIYDLRFEQNAARWFPPSNDPYQRPWAVQINDDRRLYLVHTTGFQYVYDSREYCVLLVERAVVAASSEE